MRTRMSFFGSVYLMIFSLFFAGPLMAAAQGEIKVAVAVDPDSLNPSHKKLTRNVVVCNAMFQQLTKPDPETGRQIPSLAESITLMENGKDYLVKLRKDAKFHNGDPVTAHDVRFTYQMFVKNPNVFKGFVLGIEDVKIIDDYTCIIVDKQPNASRLVRRWSWMDILPKKYYEKVGEKSFNQNPIGSGPFRLVDKKISESYTFEAVPNHHDGPQNFQRIKYFVVSDEVTRVFMLRSGEVDLVVEVPPQFFKTLQDEKHIKLKTAVVPSWYGLIFHQLASEEINDPNLRLAFNYAVNRKEIVDKIYLGLAYPVHHFGGVVEIGYDPNLKYEYNPEKARQLVKASNYTGESLRLTYADLAPGATQVAEAIQGYMKEVGVKIKLVHLEAGALISQWRSKDKKGIGIGSLIFWAGHVDPDGRLFGGVRSTAPWNFWKGRPDIDHLVDAQRQEMNLEKREAIIKKMHQKLHSDPLVTGLVGLKAIYAMRDRVEYTWPAKDPFARDLFRVKIVK